jgi:hypothetical protein
MKYISYMNKHSQRLSKNPIRQRRDLSVPPRGEIFDFSCWRARVKSSGAADSLFTKKNLLASDFTGRCRQSGLGGKS